MLKPEDTTSEFYKNRVQELENRLELYSSIINNMLKGEMDRIEKMLPDTNDEVLNNIKHFFTADKFAFILKSQVEGVLMLC